MFKLFHNLIFGNEIRKTKEINLYRDIPKYVHWSTVLKLQSEKIQRLENALRPFADQAQILNESDSENVPDVWHFKLNGSISAITVGDCRHALETLNKQRLDHGH